MTAPMYVYRDFDQASLDAQYRARDQVPDFSVFTRRYRSLTDQARARLEWRTVQYGPTEAECMDLYPAGPGAPVFIYLHGGYWRIMGREDAAFMAEALVGCGIAVAAVNYGLCPAVTLDEIVRQCRAAVAWLWRHGAAEAGIDTDRIFAGGSSAGGHLAGMLLASGWQGGYGMPDGVVKGGLGASGLYDLEPIRLSEINGWVGLDEAAARRNSPLRHLPPAGSSVILTVGGLEQGEFKRQTAEYAAACRAAGATVEEVAAPERHHFDVILDLCDTGSVLSRALFRGMGMASTG